MARPRSDDKRKAILDAALRVFEERGTVNAPTSAISKAAGVAEGTLFTYFKTKDELTNELYLELRQEFSRHMGEFPYKASAKARLRYIWDRYLDLAAEHPRRLKVLTQLRASGRFFKENEPRALALVEALRAVTDAAKVNELRNMSPEYLVLMVRSQLEMTVEFIHANPECAASCREQGFRMVWSGLTGK
jgi:AcrR family transcriptional regulator